MKKIFEKVKRFRQRIMYKWLLSDRDRLEAKLLKLDISAMIVRDKIQDYNSLIDWYRRYVID